MTQIEEMAEAKELETSNISRFQRGSVVNSRKKLKSSLKSSTHHASSKSVKIKDYESNDLSEIIKNEDSVQSSAANNMSILKKSSLPSSSKPGT